MSAWRQIEDAISRIGEGQAKIISHSEKPWASVTFSGTRHQVLLSFAGDEAVTIGAAMLEELPVNELHLPGYLVADVAILFTHRQGLTMRLDYMLELLVLDDTRIAA